VGPKVPAYVIVLRSNKMFETEEQAVEMMIPAFTKACA